MEEEFIRFIKINYDTSLDGIKLKLDHSIRVQHLSNKIATSLKWKAKEISLAQKIGLLHDIGRFYEYEKYHNYHFKNFDHGEYGANILLKDSLYKIFGIKDEELDILINAIRYHDKYEISKEYKNNKQCKLIRDTDKVDILRILSEKSYNIDSYEISKEVKKEFFKRNMIHKKYIKSLKGIENIVLLFALVYDINFNESLKIISENEYLEKIYNKVNNKEVLKDYYEEIKRFIEKRLNIC